MCDQCRPAQPEQGSDGPTRRSVLRALVAAPLYRVVSAARPPVTTATTPVATALATYGTSLHPRRDWAAGLAPKGPMAVEPVVHALLVHHTVTPNAYPPDRVPAILRSMYAYHTGPEKGWPDVAYSFFVDRFGGIWEGRDGSATHPVEGSATGGNQGSTRLCTLVGDFTTEAPSLAMVDSLTKLLAALADMHKLDSTPNAVATFVSRGSNRWKKGSTVRIPTIAGHRNTSMTTCPGDGVYPLISTGGLARKVTALRAG